MHVRDSSHRIRYLLVSASFQASILYCLLSTDIPPYIGFSSPKPSDEIPVLHQPIAQNSAIENYLLSSQGYFPSSLRGSQIWNTSLNGPFTFTADQLVVSRGPNEAALETPQFQNDQIETSWNSGLPRINQNEVMLYVPSPGTVTSPSSHAFGETCVVDSLAENSFAWIDQSQTLSTPTWAEPSSTSALWMTLPSPVPNSTIASRVATPTALRYQHSQAGGHQISSTQDIDQMCLSTRIRFYGTNPETAISSVHMIRTLLGRIQDNDFRNAHVFAHGTSAKTLLQELGSQALFSDVANVAGCIYQASADMIQPQTAAHHVLRTNIQMISPEDYDGHEQMSRVPGGDELNDADSARLESKMTSYCDFWITGGFLQIQMRRTQRGAPADAHNTLYSIAILAIPKVRTRTAGGILVTFARRTQDLPIYPIIRTFNVVPRDSEIIIYTERNNLEGVRRLIEEKKASPRDVDPWGVSLLGVNSSSC